MNLSIIAWGATILGGAGLWLVISRFFDVIVEFFNAVFRMLRRKYEPAAVKWLREGMDPTRAEQEITKKYVVIRLADSLIFWAVLGVVFAFIGFDKLVSPIIFAVTFVGGEIFIATKKSAQLAKLNSDVANLILQFTSRFPVKRSIIGTLDDTAETIKDGELKTALNQTRALLHLNRPFGDAMRPLLALKNPTVRQFATLIADAQETAPEVLEDVMGTLQKEVRSRSGLFCEIRQSLTILRITTRVLQVVLTIALFVAALHPNWRDYFISNNSNWVFLLCMIFLAVCSSFYVEMEVQQLEES